MATRRQFMESLAAAGGFGAAYAAMRAMGLAAEPQAAAAPLQLPRAPGNVRVVILGAGIAGLVSAWELTQAGYDVTVLEARPRPGGRNWTIRAGTRIDMTDGTSQLCAFAPDLYLNAGPARLPSYHQTMLGYCRQFGVPLETEVNQSRSAYMHNKAANGGQKIRLRQVMADSRGHVAELLSKSINRGRLDDQLGPEDRERMVAFLKSFGDLSKDYEYTGSARAGWKTPPGWGLQSGVPMDPLPMKTLLDEDLWIATLFDEFIDWQATMLQPVGGMDRIPAAFASRLGYRIRYNTPIAAMRKTPTGLRIILAPQAGATPDPVEAEYAICTLPLNILAAMPADITPNRRAALQRIAYDEAMKTAFEAPRFWEADQIYGGISYVHGDTGVIWYPSHGFHDRTGIVLGAYTVGAPAARLAALPLSDRIAAASDAIEGVHPGAAAQLSKGVSVAWSKIPYSQGPWAKEWTRDAHHPEGNDPADCALLCEPDGPIYFATANLTPTPGWQEGAALSAHRAVAMIAEHAQRSAPP